MLFTSRVADWLPRIRGEFEAAPGQRVTIDEAARAWDVEPHLLEMMLDALVDVGFLRCGGDGFYLRRRPQDLTEWSAPSRPASRRTRRQATRWDEA